MLKMSPHRYAQIGAVFGGLSVVIGAFAAHALKQRITGGALDTVETGVRYQFIHAVALLAAGVAGKDLWKIRKIQWACQCWALGVLLFSGSLYLMVATGWRGFGAVTPWGGAALIFGWLLMALGLGRGDGR